jgi:hypothetical protein
MRRCVPYAVGLVLVAGSIALDIAALIPHWLGWVITLVGAALMWHGLRASKALAALLRRR